MSSLQCSVLSRVVSIFLLIFLLNSLCARTAFATTNWYDGVVDNDGAGYVGTHSDAAIDASGFMHVSYYDATNETLKYATNASGEWVTTTVEFTLGGSPTLWIDATSIALDSAGNVYIAFADSYTYSLQYVTNVTGRWVTHTVDTTSGSSLVGFYVSLAMDSSDNLHISYYEYDWVSGEGWLKYATGSSGGASWALTRIDGGSGANVGSFSSLALDSSDAIHISYRDETNETLKYATDSLGGWVSMTVDNTANVGRMSSLALDSTNKAHISYLDDDNQEIKYATNALGSWAEESVVTTGSYGYYSTIAVDSSDNLHIVYYDDNSSSLECAVGSSGSWVTSPIYNAVDATLSGVASAFNAAGELFVTFSDDGDLKYTTTEAMWSVQVLDDGDGDDIGQYVSAKYNYTGAGDQWQVSYYDATNQDLKYGTFHGSWTVETVDSIGNVGQYSSIAYDSSGYSHIAYYDATNRNLKYATNASGLWVKTNVDTLGFVGEYASIAMDSADKAHISYYDATNSNLKYATNKNGTWIKTTVDGVGIVGTHSAIAVDSANAVHIGYNYGGDRLKYATNATGRWVKAFADNTAGVGTFVAIAIDSSDKAHVSYHDELNTALKYATNATGSWVKTTVDNSDIVGQYSSISITQDGTDTVHIAYYATTNAYHAVNTTGLMHATLESGTWATELADNESAVESLVSIGGGFYQYQYDDALIGKYASIAAVANGTYIFYYDETAGDLRWAVSP